MESKSRAAFSFYYDALENIKQGEFAAALTNLDSAIYYQPGYSNFYFVKGQVFDFMDQPDSSIKAYEHSVELKSFNPEAWVRLGELHLSKKNYGTASFYFKKAVQNNPDSLRFYLRLSESYFHAGKYHLALDCLIEYQRLNKLTPIELKKWQGLGFLGLEDYKKAANLLKDYIQHYPNDSEALKYFGIAKFKLGEYDKAISALNEASSSNSADPEIYLYRARYFMLHNKEEIAREQLEVALRNDSLNTDILFELGLFHFQQGNIDKSKSYFSKVLEINPSTWKAYRYLGIIAEQEKNLEEALRNYKLFLENTYAEDQEIRERVKAIEKTLLNK